jgi:putative serine protease PepD
VDSPARSVLRALLLPTAALLAVTAAAAGCTTTTGSAIGTTGNAGTSLQDSYEQVIRAVLPSVMQINTSTSTGSGVVYDSKGDIVTNEHVIGDATTVHVLPVSGDKVLTAQVIGEYEPDDLAVIRVTKDAGELRPAKFGNSDDAEVGEIVLAMGNPLGLTDSVTQGIISALGRTVSASERNGLALITSAIQTSAAINPGNSGGALVNLDDQVIGIPTLAAHLPESGGVAPGIGFAIPSNTVKDIANQLIKDGRVTSSDRAALNAELETSANGHGQPEGVAILSEQNGGAAQRAGLEPGSVIVALDGQQTPTAQVLLDQVAMHSPGTTVTLTVRNGGATRNVRVTLGSYTG